MIMFDNAFSIGDTVYLKVEERPSPYMVIGILYEGVNNIKYRIRGCEFTTDVFDFEITQERIVSISL